MAAGSNYQQASTPTFNGYNPNMQGMSSGSAYSGGKGSSQPKPFIGYSQNYAMPNKFISGQPVYNPYYDQFKMASAQNQSGTVPAGYANGELPEGFGVMAPGSNALGNSASPTSIASTLPSNQTGAMPDPQTALTFKKPGNPTANELMQKQMMAYQQQMGYIQQPNSPMQFGNSPYTNQGYLGGSLLNVLRALFGGF